MNLKALVRLSNIVGIISIILLIYWVFVFISVQVFGLRVFRENITEVFYMSVLGLLALMFGALIINVMSNLTRIANKHNQDEISVSKFAGRKFAILFCLSFPLVFGLLYTLDFLTSKKKERFLLSSAESIVNENRDKANTLIDYKFERKWILEAKNILELLSRTDKNFPHITLIVNDTIGTSKVFLQFTTDYYYDEEDTIPPLKKHFIFGTTKQEREYLTKVFEKDFVERRYSAHDGRYELFYPYIKDNKKIVLYFSDYQKYGK